LRRNPAALDQIDHRALEELIAASYDRAGFDEVILTPRSGDHGRDVIATKKGMFSIRIFDQVKARGLGQVVDANDVRALLGSLMLTPNVTKAVFTTTSTFAPRLLDDPAIGPNVPHRLELRPRNVLLPWLQTLRPKDAE
jgi:restriction system protein